MITREITAPSHASREIWKIRNIPAATSVEAEIMESSVASSPEFTRESDYLHYHGNTNYDEGNNAVIRGLGVDYLLHGLHKGCYTGIEHYNGDYHGTEILYAPVSEGVLLVRFSAGKLCAHNGYDGASGIGNVVHGIENDGDGVRHHPYNGLKARQEHIGYYPYNAGPDDGLFAG